MTKTELSKCEEAVIEAITSENRSRELWKSYEAYKAKYEDTKKSSYLIDAEIKLRDSDQHLGYAQGIHQMLAILGYKSEKMKELETLI